MRLNGECGEPGAASYAERYIVRGRANRSITTPQALRSACGFFIKQSKKISTYFDFFEKTCPFSDSDVI